ncbi:Phosphatidic acid phosphatase type 2/haloperoxidase [Candidatus Magnetomorum sp. HK-1]|nr:Phosphatidic acid phosphatase type 2/haloperoxidase [Candidatus Magnetomorum sp. HK-1]
MLIETAIASCVLYAGERVYKSLKETLVKCKQINQRATESEPSVSTAETDDEGQITEQNQSLLPVITKKNRFLSLMLGFTTIGVLYFGVRSIDLRTPWLRFPNTSIPFLPNSIFLYLSLFPFMIMSIWSAENDWKRSRTFYAMLLATIIACGFFALLPIYAIRMNVSMIGGIVGWLWRMLYSTDTATNLFPSLHAAFAYLSASDLHEKEGCWSWLAPLWATAILISTLTTRQHNIADLAGGLLLGISCQKVGEKYLGLPEEDQSDKLQSSE